MLERHGQRKIPVRPIWARHLIAQSMLENDSPKAGKCLTISQIC